MNLGQLRRNPDTSYLFCIDQIVKKSENSPFYLYLDSLLMVSYVLQQFLVNILIVPPHYAKPHRGVSKDTISRWIRTVMQKAGVDITVFKPHTTRAASTSKDRSCNVSLPAVLKAASWSSDCVFNTFYNKPVQPQNL